MEVYVPLEIPAGSQWLQGVGGLALMALARGLARRKHVAWIAAVCAFGILPILHLFRSFDWPYVVISLAMFAWLLACRREFVARSGEPSIRLGLIAIPIAALVIHATAFAMLYQVRREIDPVRNELSAGHHRRKERTIRARTIAQAAAELIFLQSTDTVTPLTKRAAAVMRIIPVGGPTLALFALVVLLRPVLLHDKPGPAARERVRALISHHGTDPLDEFALLPDKHYFFATDGSTVIAFALWRDFAVTLADPIGPATHKRSALVEFITFCRRNDWQPVFYEISQEIRDACETLGFASFKIAEDARIDLDQFKLDGKKFQRHRTALNHAKKYGWQFRWYDPGERIDHGLEAQLRLVSDEWLEAKHGGEMTFDLGAYSPEYIAQFGAAVLINAEGRVEAFSTWQPYDQGRGRSLDLMRCRTTTNVMDANILMALEHFRKQGIARISLGNAPLANIDAALGNPLNREEKAVRYVYENFNKVYGYKSLFEFKDKYQPDWRPRYLAYKGAANLPLIALSLAAVHTPGGLKKYLKS
jgi:lysylphosphatidylglycerol synthetase-like protein (DUF2156 family)